MEVVLIVTYQVVVPTEFSKYQLQKKMSSVAFRNHPIKEAENISQGKGVLSFLTNAL